jgi:hypothetical protein
MSTVSTIILAFGRIKSRVGEEDGTDTGLNGCRRE